MVVPFGATSDIVFTLARVPQGSILGTLLFFVYINDIVTDIYSPIPLPIPHFGDDTTLYNYIEVDDPQRAADSINAAKIQSLANSWSVTFNPLKTESLLFSRKTKRLLFSRAGYAS